MSLKKVEIYLSDFVLEELGSTAKDMVEFVVDSRFHQEFRRRKEAVSMSYSLYTSGPIDDWRDFIHLQDVSENILKFIPIYPKVKWTFYQVWDKILSKLQWAWILCPDVDKDLRCPDVYVDLTLCEDYFEANILFKSDKSGTANLIIDSCFDEKEKISKIYHEQGCDWEKVFP